MKKTILSVSIISSLLVALGAVGQFDYESEVAEEKFYCEMVEIHRGEKQATNTIGNQRGWPDFKGIYSEVCGKYK